MIFLNSTYWLVRFFELICNIGHSRELKMSLVHNERTKLTATFLNGIAIAIFAVGAFAPAISSFSVSYGPSAEVRTTALICIVVASALHLLARAVLRGLRDVN